MCKLASFVLTKDAVFWSKTSDSHEDIIEEYKLHADGARGPNVLRVEVSPEDGDLSRPLSEWWYRLDQDDVPKWAEDAAVCEERARAALSDWAAHKLTGWYVYEAFHPVNPLKLTRARLDEAEIRRLLKEWASVWDSVGVSVWASVWDSVRASVGASVRVSVWASVWDSVGDSVWASVWAYMGGLFPNIRNWKYAEKLGPTPWAALCKLWYAGYVPSYDGTTWRLHAGPQAEVVYTITAEELRK